MRRLRGSHPELFEEFGPEPYKLAAVLSVALVSKKGFPPEATN